MKETVGIEEIDLSLVKKRSLAGVLSLVSRSFIIQGFALLGSNIFLPLFLDPKTFGIFAIVSAFINVFNYFSDIGLAGALIQKKEKITDEDLKTTFLTQQILVVAILVIILILSPFAKVWLKLDNQAIYLFYALAFSFFLSSLKTIPSVLLERNLKFNLFVVPQIIETLVYNIVVVCLAWKGFGLNSFTWAVLARGGTGLIAMYIVSPWKPGFAFSRKSLSHLLKFGVPYQINSMMAMVKDDLMTVFLGGVIGSTGLGYLNWAKKWAELPLRFLMDNVTKVVFPAYARMQDEEENLILAVEKTLFFLSFLTFPILVALSIFASDFVRIYPAYLKWEPALIALYLYCFNSAWATISTSMTNLLNATGRIKTTFKLMIMWLVLTWILMPVLGLKFGYNGVAFASALIALSSAVAIYVARRSVSFDLISSVGKPLLASTIMGVAIFTFRPETGSLTFSVVLRILTGGVVYLAASYLLVGQSLITDTYKILYEFKKKH